MYCVSLHVAINMECRVYRLQFYTLIKIMFHYKSLSAECKRNITEQPSNLAGKSFFRLLMSISILLLLDHKSDDSHFIIPCMACIAEC